MNPQFPGTLNPRPSTSLILLRENSHTLEVYLMRRSSKSKFMGGMYVFPGGAVTPSDTRFSAWEPYIDLDREQLEQKASACNLPFDHYFGYCIAGIRETMEEAGVLVGSDAADQQPEFSTLRQTRKNALLSDEWFLEKISSGPWSLQLSQLNFWAIWITPEKLKTRFETVFFVVPMPKNQTCDPDEHEVMDGIWIEPARALEKSLQGSIPMSPPTLSILRQLMTFSSIKELKQHPPVKKNEAPIMPRAALSSKGPMVLLPWDPMFSKFEKWNHSQPPGNVLDPLEPFSRLWNDNGFWKPVSNQPLL